MMLALSLLPLEHRYTASTSNEVMSFSLQCKDVDSFLSLDLAVLHRSQE